MPRFRRLVTLATLAAAALTLSACSAGATATGDNDGSGTSTSLGATSDTVTIAMMSEPQNFDFTTTGGATIPQLLMTNVYEGLVYIDQQGKVQPRLADSWDLSDDRTTYTFHLHPAVTFSNGQALTAEDVKASLDRVKTDWVVDLKQKMDVVDSVTVNSPTEVEVKLKQPSNAWLFDMGTSVGAIMPKTLGDIANTPIGTGPFVISDVKKGESVTLTARDDYWGEQPGMKTIKIRYFADAVATTNALRAGDVDLIYGLAAPDLIDTFKNDNDYTVTQGTTNREVILLMNNKAKPFDDIRVRQAVNYAIDDRSVLDTAWAGYGTLIGALVPPSDPYYEDLTGLYPYNPDKARELLKEAGAEHPEITLSIPTLPYATAATDIVVSQLKDVGFNVKVESTEFPAVWIDKVWTKHEYQATIIGTAEARDLLTTFDRPGNYTGYDNSKIHDIAVAADRGTEQEFIDGMKQVARTVAEDAAADYLWLYAIVSVGKAGLTGIQQNEVTEAFSMSTLKWSN